MQEQAYRIHLIHTLPLGVPHRPKPVSRHRTGQHAREVGDDEAQRTAAQAPHQTPELARRRVRPVLRHALLPHHLLEDVAELGIFGPLPLGSPGGPGGTTVEEVPRPRVRALGGGARLLWNLLVGLLEGVRLRGRGAEEPALGVVVSAAGGVGEGVVGVVDELELAGAGVALRGVGWDAVRVSFQRGAEEEQIVSWGVVTFCKAIRVVGGLGRRAACRRCVFLASLPFL